MRAASRLLLALTLMAWGQFAFSVDYYWHLYASSGNYISSAQFASAELACKSMNGAGVTAVFIGIVPYNASNFDYFCRWRLVDGGSLINEMRTRRFGDSCPLGYVYNPSTGACDAPKDCSQAKPLKGALDCTYHSVFGKQLVSCDSIVSVDGCEYSSSYTGYRCKASLDGSNQTICVGDLRPTGQPSKSGDPSLGEGEYAEVPEQGSGEQKCFDFGGSQLCMNPDNPGCDVYKGSPWCYAEGDTCGEIGGKFVCLPKSSKQCTYVNGAYQCVSTGNPPGSQPPKLISTDSSDHPKHGGNADGDDTNDPMASGTAGGGGGSSQGVDDAATNKSISDLGDLLGDKLDDSNDLLTDIRDALSPEDDSGVGEGSPDDAEAMGQSAGDQIASMISETSDQLSEERIQEAEGTLDQLPNTVTSWFGSDGSAVGLDGLDSVLPAPVACSDYVVDLSLGSYSANLKLPVCQLSAVKPLLEWVIWMVTFIGVWKIGYSALRNEDAKASKGGF